MQSIPLIYSRNIQLEDQIYNNKNHKTEQNTHTQNTARCQLDIAGNVLREMNNCPGTHKAKGRDGIRMRAL